MIPSTNIEAEQSVLGSILIEKNIILKVVDVITPEDFSMGSHETIFAGMMDLYRREIPIDQVTISTWLKANKLFDEVGGKGYLEELCKTVLTSSHVVGYAKLVKEASLLRKLTSAGERIAKLPEELEVDAIELVEEAEKIIYEIRGKKASTSNYSLPKEIGKYEAFVMERIEKAKTGEKIGIITGFSGLDRDCLLEPGNLFVLAARPSVGKSALALNIAYNSAMYGANVYYASLEMTPEELTHRLYARLAKISGTRFKYGNVTKEILDRCAMQLRDMSGDIEIDFVPGAGISKVLLGAKRRQKTDLIIVDHIDLLQEPMARGESRTQMLGRVTSALKAYAGEHKCVILALSQLSREAKGDLPELYHLRDSGAKEQDADVVWLLHRNIDPDADDTTAYLRIAKNRHGRVGDLQFHFDAPFCLFSEVSPPAKAVKTEVVSWEDIG